HELVDDLQLPDVARDGQPVGGRRGGVAPVAEVPAARRERGEHGGQRAERAGRAGLPLGGRGDGERGGVVARHQVPGGEARGRARIAVAVAAAHHGERGGRR